MSRVTIITPCYQAERFIPRLLRTVATQTFTDWTHVVVDDGSDDRTAALVAERLPYEPRLCLVRQTNEGAAAARRRGFAEADAESAYLLFLDADDELRPDMLEVMTGYLDAHPEVSMVFCDHETLDGQGRPVEAPSPGNRYVPTRFGVRRLNEREAATPFAAFLFWAAVTPSDVLLRRSAYERAGGFTAGQVYTEDLDLWMRISLRDTVHYLPERLVRRRIHKSNLSLRTDVRAHERKLFELWLSADWLSADERRMVDALWRWRQSRLLPTLWLEWGAAHLRRKEFFPALVCYLRSGKRVAQYAGAALQRKMPAGPVW